MGDEKTRGFHAKLYLMMSLEPTAQLCHWVIWKRLLFTAGQIDSPI